ncbi:MAG: flagellar motor switch protein FliY [Helicobacteraceae bacterium]|jgi:flagellar motor switch protein FliN/FliY|nr:flagellar motor switch protein FliY [Helicobacteraceae bacterium]
MSFIELLQKEIAATVNGLLGSAPAVDLKEVSALNADSSVVAPVATIDLDFSGPAFGKGRAIIPPQLATALSDMMLGGSGASKETMENDDLDATKEIISQIFGALSSSLAAQHDLAKFSIKTGEAKFIAAGALAELGGFAKMFSFNFTIGAIESVLMFAIDKTIAAALDKNGAPPPNAPEKAFAPNARAPQREQLALTPEENKNIQLLMDVRLVVRVRIGKKQMLLRDVINMDIGSIVELDQLANEPLDILVDNKKIAEGEVVIVDGNFGVQITAIGTKRERLEQLKG